MTVVMIYLVHAVYEKCMCVGVRAYVHLCVCAHTCACLCVRVDPYVCVGPCVCATVAANGRLWESGEMRQREGEDTWRSQSLAAV